jgi:hypothetical protein
MRDDERLAEVARLARVAKESNSALAAQNAVDRIAQLIPIACAGQEELLASSPSVGRRMGNTHPPLPGYVVDSIMAPSRILTFSNIEPLPPETTSVSYRMEFDAGSGWIIGMRGSIVDETSWIWRSSMEVQLELNDGEHLITDGERADFANYDDLFTQAQVYFPLRRYVISSDNLYATFRNLSDTTTLTPTLSVFFCRDRDMRTGAAMFESLKKRC